MGLINDKKSFLDFLMRNDSYNKNYEGEVLYFYIGPLIGIRWSLWMITYAILCNEYGRKNIAFLINDCWSNGHLIYANYADQTMSIKEIAYYLKNKGYQVVWLSALPNADYKDSIIEKTAKLCAIYFMRSSYKGNGYFKSLEKWNIELKKLAPKISYAVKYIGIKKLVFVGAGVYDGYLLYRMCREYGVETWAYNSYHGNVCEKNGISVQLMSLKETYKIIYDSKNVNKLLKDALEVMQCRVKGLKDIGNDKGFCFQSIGEKKIRKSDYVLFPNYEADAAVLGANRVFEDDFEWMHQTINFILKNTKKTIAVRQHPASRRINYSAEIFKQMLQDYEENERVILYDCFAEANSYDLIKESEVVIVNTSTIGMEAAYMGKRVISETESFYAKAGFIEYYDTKEAYFDALLEYKRRELSMDEKNRLLCMYGLRQLCGDVAESFTISDYSFINWINNFIEDIYEDDEVKLLVDCLCRDKMMVEEKYKYLYERNVI